MSFKRFLILFCCLTAVLGGIAAWLGTMPGVLVPRFWVLFGFLAGLTLIAYAVAYTGLKKGGETSIQLIMASITIKLIISMLFVLFYLRTNKVDSVLFAAQFFSLYFFFTIFEVYSLLCNLRHQKKTKNL